MHSPYWITERKPHWKTRQSEYTPERLWDLAVEYFKFCEENPLADPKGFAYEGTVTIEQIPRMRAMTIEGLCAHIGIGRRTWHQWASGDRKRPDLEEVIDRIKTIMDAQKLEGAMAGLLNATVVSRVCGLAEKTELTGKDGGAIETKHTADEGFAAICDALDAAAIAKSRGAGGKSGMDSEGAA